MRSPTLLLPRFSALLAPLLGLLLTAGGAQAQATYNQGLDLRPEVLARIPGWIDLPPEEWARGKNGPQPNFDFTRGADPTPHNAGFFGQRLRRALAERGPLAPEAEAALNRYRRQRTLFLTERVLFATILIAAGGAFIATDYKWDTPEYILAGVAFTSLLSNVLVTRNTNRHLQDAVKAYQGTLLPQRPTGFEWQRLRPDFGAVAPQRGGGAGVVVGWRL